MTSSSTFSGSSFAIGFHNSAQDKHIPSTWLYKSPPVKLQKSIVIMQQFGVVESRLDRERAGNMQRVGEFFLYQNRCQDRPQMSSLLQPLAAIKINRGNISVPEVAAEEVEEDDCLCPVGCVREIFTREELEHAISQTKERKSLLVVDFYKTACGSCKYIERGFMKLCKGEAEANRPVVFLKHNVMDEYEEQSEIAEEFRIKVVPLFYFYSDGVLVESFPTREKTKILEAINKYSNSDYEGLL